MNRTIYVLNGIDMKSAITMTDALLNRIAEQKPLPKHSVD
jgi:sRNA-binding regulator protein Hfq